MAKHPSLDDLFKVSPALAVADQLLGSNSPWRRPEEEPSLADEFIASTHRGNPDLRGRLRRQWDETMLRYRLDMRKAHRFVLDDAFVDMATEMAMTTPEKTLARLQYATLPYEQTWIEFNLHAKMKAIHRVNGSTFKNQHEVAERLGMLVQRIDDTSAVCTLVSAHGNEQVIPHMTCYFFSLNERTFVSSNAAFYGCVPMVIGSRAPESEYRDGEIVNLDLTNYVEAASHDSVGKASLWGYTLDKNTILDTKPKAQRMRTPEFLLRHGDIGLSRLFFTTEDLSTVEEGREAMKTLILVETREFTGSIRWLTTVLAMLNQVPVHTDLVERSHQMRIGHFKKHKFVDYHRVTLRLPKMNPIPYLERQLRGPSERRHRAHEVRAHWRTYLHAEHCGPDEHDWTYDYDDGYRLCGKCDAYGRLIHEHIRGNQELGWVRKDYVIKPSGQK
jgi:hypothetical protein